MRRFFVKNLLFVLAVNILVKPVWIFLVDRTVQNRVGHSAYGTYQAIFNLGIIFQIVLDFGLNNFNTSIISQNSERLRRFFPSMLTARLLLILLYGIIVYLIGWAIGYNEWELGLLSGVILIQALSSLLLFMRSNVAALHKFRADGILSVTDRLLMIIVCSVLLFYPGFAPAFKIEWFVIAQIICYAAAVVAGYLILKNLSTLQLRLSIDAAKVAYIIKQSAPYALLIFLMSVYTRSDTILLERLSGPQGKDEAGIYAAAYRLLDVGNMIGLMLAGVLLPLFGRMLMQKQDVNPIVLLATNMMLPVAFITAIAGFFFGTDIMQLLYVDTGAYDGWVFTVLMASFPGFCIMYIYSTLLTANGNLRILNRIAVTGVIINLSLNLLLIPEYQALGAATTAFVTQFILAVLFISFSRQKLNLNRNIRLIFSYVIFICLLFLAGLAVQLSPVNWLIQLAVFAAIGGVMIFTFRFVSVHSVKQLLDRKVG